MCLFAFSIALHLLVRPELERELIRTFLWGATFNSRSRSAALSHLVAFSFCFSSFHTRKTWSNWKEQNQHSKCSWRCQAADPCWSFEIFPMIILALLLCSMQLCPGIFETFKKVENKRRQTCELKLMFWFCQEFSDASILCQTLLLNLRLDFCKLIQLTS